VGKFFTARQAADLCGEIERKKVSRSRNESSQRRAFSFLDSAVIAADPGSVGEGITITLRREHLFAPRAFTSLKVSQAIVKAFDGVRVLEPWVVWLKPMHENPELSWFETAGRITGDVASVPASRSYLRPTLSRFLRAGRPSAAPKEASAASQASPWARARIHASTVSSR
jgi:hypothetical protein